MSDLKEKLQTEPDVMFPAMQEFLKNYKNISTTSKLCSALRTFGKYQGVALSLAKKSKTKSTRRLQFKGSSSIGVQPTATARRKPGLGRGAKCLTAGRPPKRAINTDHANYQKAGSDVSAAFLPIKKMRKPAPHSLSHAVQHNHSLGKTHSKK